MQKIRYSFLFVIGLALIFGTASAAFSQKLKKNEGFLRVTSSPKPYPVKIDGRFIGESGVGRGRDFRLQAGSYTVTVEGPDGHVFKKAITIEKQVRLCICLTVETDIITRPCPYNIVVDGPPDSVLAGDKVVFSARNLVRDTIPVNYRWSVSGGVLESGQGTSSITVSTKGMAAGQTVRAFLDVTDDVYGSTCFQKDDATVYVEKLIPPEPIPCDLWESKSPDDDKARFDNCNLIYRQTPNSQIYIILYQGTDKRSVSMEKLAKRASDYFNDLGVPTKDIVLVRGGNRARTSAHVWIIPPGARTPVP